MHDTRDGRQAFMRNTLAWISEHYEPGTSEPVAWENAVRAQFGLPLEDERMITRKDFTPVAFTTASHLFRDLVLTARAGQAGDIEVTQDVETCIGAWCSVEQVQTQRDLTVAQQRQASTEAMLDALQFYVTYHPGGLFDATRDLNVVVSTDFASLLEGGT